MSTGGVRKTHSRFLAEFEARANGEYTLLSTYYDGNTKIDVLHHACNSQYQVRPNNFLVGNRCPYCFGKKRRTTEQYAKELYEIFQGEYELIGPYINAQTRVTLIHHVCGKSYEVYPSSPLKGHRCAYCAGKRTYTHDEFLEKVYEATGDEYEVLTRYVKGDDKILFRHTVCGHEYKATGTKFLSGRRCPKCAGNIKKTTEQFVEELIAEVEGEYSLVSDYKTAKDKVTLQHHICGNHLDVTPDNFLRGRRCRYCTNMSEAEREIYDFLKSNEIAFEVECVFEDLVSVNPLRFDFLIYVNEKEFFLLEHDGAQHFYAWGDELNLQSVQARDKLKNDYCAEKGYHLLRISYREAVLEVLAEELAKYGIQTKRYAKQLSFNF